MGVLVLHASGCGESLPAGDKGRLHVPGKIYQLRAVLDIHTGAVIKKTPQIVKAGSVARIRMKTDKVPLEKGERVVIRYNGDTVAAGLLEETQ